MKEGWELKLLLVLLLGTSLIACDSTPSCVDMGYTQPYTQIQQEPVATSSSSLAPLATGVAVGAVVGHLATKNNSKVTNKYKAKKVSLKKSSYKSKSSKRK